MSSVNRFIQFNNEQINTRERMGYERLLQALTNNPYLKMNTRKFLEFSPEENSISLSVFWKHRGDEIEHNGFLSDIYLASLGYWEHFSITAWNEYAHYTQKSTIPKFLQQLAILGEEVRLVAQIKSSRPGTKRSLVIREEVQYQAHTGFYFENLKRGFVADALLNYLYCLMTKGELVTSNFPIDFELISIIQQKWFYVFDAKSTNEVLQICREINYILEDVLVEDCQLEYVAIPSFGSLALVNEESSGKMEHLEDSNASTTDSIKERYQTWHRETQSNKQHTLEYELSSGVNTAADSGRKVDDIDHPSDLTIGKGQSTGQTLIDIEKASNEDIQREEVSEKRDRFGPENRFVTIVESDGKQEVDEQTKWLIHELRKKQLPLVRSILQEMKKRMHLKQQDRREHLSIGRLSRNLLPLWLEERPKLFYKKDAPSKELDAVFGLLVDGSSSMIDKMDETKEAVLLFHDVLRQLSIPHDIVQYDEDSFEATEKNQPNRFQFSQRMDNFRNDASQAIFSMEPGEDNRDGLAIRWMMERLEKRKEKHKFLLLFSDGEPSAFQYETNGLIDTAKAVELTKKKDIQFMHLFLSNFPPTEDQENLFRQLFGHTTVSTDNLHSFVSHTTRLLRRMLSSAI
ncbi:VWA domain-containing protein [Paenisporosarcina cavernae]|uniref:VWA domain-containing protein n=1 Tax=Paenisporosarcina cavernae TaxID=2320858 RepID=A0A385YS78_9BACL|nr:VWA domain-containing protein [Paenisporosarcina cavernae]AYC29466.1 VWA domain-containing protein [Paenisporosarcina cavernae]